ncbi:MAG: hypothetical protein KBT87_13785 [Gammaproteobacteria bacterium]|nr:hypothetical protein [Gammaproteobacteria bacterium]MBQ0775742.1 hypothetical protein [Gammaproteobacteria bacterium]|tara:strand:- start:94544 stop:95080 length:537 start_codon:yes stop_codon:yes gene_type:complete
MAQILLAVTLIVVVSAVSASCWRGGQKRLAIGVLIGGSLVLVAALLALGRQVHLQPEVNVDQIVIELDTVSATGAGWRLTGKISNNSDIAISQVNGTVNVRSASPECGSAPCSILTQQPFQLLMHVGSGQSYPFRIAINNVSLHDPMLPKSKDSSTGEQYLWELEPTSALGYADSNKR